MPRSIEDQVRKTYFSLRLSAAVIAFTFPILLLVGGHIAGFSLRDSMSAYYHATPTSLKASEVYCADVVSHAPPIYPQAGIMRNWFVGLLFAIAAVLHANKGHTEKENWALSIAGVFAVCIAVFPMPWACKPESSFTPHGTCAMAFFACIAFVSIVCSRDTVQLLKPKKQGFYKKLYLLWGSLMVIAPAVAYGFNKWGVHRDNAIYWAEFTGIYAFGLYWVTKTFEIKEIQKEESAKPHSSAQPRITIA
jgi:hypothetical membrane protein